MFIAESSSGLISQFIDQLFHSFFDWFIIHSIRYLVISLHSCDFYSFIDIFVPLLMHYLIRLFIYFIIHLFSSLFIRLFNSFFMSFFLHLLISLFHYFIICLFLFVDSFIQRIVCLSLFTYLCNYLLAYLFIGLCTYLLIYLFIYFFMIHQDSDLSRVHRLKSLSKKKTPT